MEIEALEESADQPQVAAAAHADTLHPSQADFTQWGRALTELIERRGYSAWAMTAQLAD